MSFSSLLFYGTLLSRLSCVSSLVEYYGLNTYSQEEMQGFVDDVNTYMMVLYQVQPQAQSMQVMNEQPLDPYRFIDIPLARWDMTAFSYVKHAVHQPALPFLSDWVDAVNYFERIIDPIHARKGFRGQLSKVETVDDTTLRMLLMVQMEELSLRTLTAMGYPRFQNPQLFIRIDDRWERFKYWARQHLLDSKYARYVLQMAERDLEKLEKTCGPEHSMESVCRIKYRAAKVSAVFAGEKWRAMHQARVRAKKLLRFHLPTIPE